MNNNQVPKIYSIHSHYDKSKKKYYLGIRHELFEVLKTNKVNVEIEDSFFRKKHLLNFAKTTKPSFSKYINDSDKEQVYFFIGK
jgi:hypothetical protein